MANTLHTQARTTPKIRAEIQSAPPAVTNAALARRYGVTAATIAKWRSRDGDQDRSHRPHTFHSTLTPAQQAQLHPSVPGWQQAQVRQALEALAQGVKNWHWEAAEGECFGPHFRLREQVIKRTWISNHLGSGRIRA